MASVLLHPRTLDIGLPILVSNWAISIQKGNQQPVDCSLCQCLSSSICYVKNYSLKNLQIQKYEYRYFLCRLTRCLTELKLSNIQGLEGMGHTTTRLR